MEQHLDKILIGGAGVVTTIIGGWDMALQVMMILVGIDILTGVCKAFINHDFASKSFRQGIVSKAGYVVIVILAFQLDKLVGNSQPIFRTATAIFYIAVEGSSIIENLGVMGVPVPKFIAERLTQLKGSVDKADLVEDAKKVEQ